MKELLKEHGVWFFMPVSNGMGHMGIPDFVCCYKGRFFAIETKAPGGALTELQGRTLAAIQAAGGHTFIVMGDTPAALVHLRATLAMLG